MIKKLLLIIVLLITNIGFTQTEKDSYEIFTAILNQQLNTENKSEIKKILVIQQFENKFNRMSEIEYIFKDSTFKNYEEDYIYRKTDTTFIKRYIKEPELKLAILGLIDNFENHPIINTKLFKHSDIEIEIIKSQKFYSYFSKKDKNIDNAWKKIKTKYKTNYVFEFSRIFYKENLATVYFEKHCGGLCGNGNFILLERINEQWIIITDIELWVS